MFLRYNEVGIYGSSNSSECLTHDKFKEKIMTIDERVENR